MRLWRTSVTSLPTGALAGRTAAATGLLASFGALALDLRDGTAGYASAGLLTLVLGACLMGWHPMRLPGSSTPDGSRESKAFGLAMVIRGTGWLALAVEASRGELGAPALGDAAMVVASILAAVTLGVVTVRRSPQALQHLLLDAPINGTAFFMLFWCTRLGPSVGFRAGTALTAGLIGLAVVCLIVITMAVIRLVTEPMRHTGAALVAAVLITIAELDALASRGAGQPVLGRLAVTCWFVGWPLLTVRMFTREREAADASSQHQAERRQLLINEWAPLVAMLTMLGVAVSRGGDLTRLFTDPVIQVALLYLALSFTMREVLLGRARVRLTAALRSQAERDPLTGLANRRGLAARVERLDALTEWAILAVDLDGFKTVNDVLGHGVGDEVLATVGSVLGGVCPPEGLAARTGGDEFALLCRGGVERGQALAEDVVRQVETAVGRLHLGLPVTASVGVGRLVPSQDAVAGVPPSEDRLTALVEAGVALRSAKESGGNGVQVYPGLVAREHLRRLLVEVGLRNAVDTGGITSSGQPLVELATGRVVGVEALARWHDAVLGDVPAAEFVAVGEQAGLIGNVGHTVLTSALAAFDRHGLAARGLTLSINVSPLELRRPGFADCLTTAVSASTLPLSQLTLEVTEAVLIGHDDPAVRTLADLASRGVQVAIDDFGAGYSALGYLRRLPVTTLKLDRSLVTESLVLPRTREIVAGVVDLAHRLDLTVVFEGIEDERTAALGLALGASLGQGYHYGRPVDWDDLAARVAAQDQQDVVTRPPLRLASPPPPRPRRRAT